VERLARGKCSSFLRCPNKLERLSSVSFSSLFHYFAGKARRRVEHLSGTPYCVGSCPNCNYKNRVERLARGKCSSLFVLFMGDEEKKFYNIDTRLQRMETRPSKRLRFSKS